MRWVSFGAMLWGLLVFFWISYEDTTLTPVTLLSATLMGLIFLRFKARYARLNDWQISALGLAAGSAVPLIATLLVAIKVSLHSHPQPDFPPETIMALIGRLPVWAFVGLVIGLATALNRRYRALI